MDSYKSFYTRTGFNATTGRYSIKVTISYQTTVITAQIGAAVNSSFVIRRTSPTVTIIVTGLFPVLNVTIALLLNLRIIIGSASVTLSTGVNLTAGDVLGLFYQVEGVTINLNIGTATTPPTVWSIHRLT
ncbi:hypothetical protein [Virgibacillus salexigens]|uniref:BclA C-terminal domain-containing protein n=1 Tax=Virgibacillus kapii TaxID=1638645 RepID=A0ABQ2DMI7_9BACI|nr:hypothetical protein [Virgibacillus kapii]GGJ64051.1 hypothetical protein GCM10007111_27440 [Virgibacillus kapii]